MDARASRLVASSRPLGSRPPPRFSSFRLVRCLREGVCSWRLPDGPQTEYDADQDDCALHDEWEEARESVNDGEATEGPSCCWCSECAFLYDSGKVPLPPGALAPLICAPPPSLRATVMKHVPSRYVDEVLGELNPTSRSVCAVPPSLAALRSAHDVWVAGCSRCLRDECIERALRAGVGASATRNTALRRYSKELVDLGRVVSLAKRSLLLQVVATLPSREPSSPCEPLPSKRRRVDAASSTDVPSAAASDVAAGAAPEGAEFITAASLPVLLDVVASQYVPRELLVETLSALARSKLDAAPPCDPTRSFRSVFARPWHPALRTVPTLRLHEMHAAALFLVLPSADYEPLVRDAAQRLANDDAQHSFRAPPWDAPVIADLGDPPSLLLSAAQSCFRAAVQDLATARFATLLRKALAPTSAAAITPSQARMLLEVAEEGLGHGSKLALTPALLDLVACYAPAVFERFRRTHVTPQARAPLFNILHFSPALDAAFREGDAGIVEWAVRTGSLPTETVWPRLSSLARSWLTARKLAPLKLLFAVNLPFSSVEGSGGYLIEFSGAEWALMSAAQTADTDLLAWALANIALIAPSAARGPAALFGAISAGVQTLRVAIASGCATTSDEQSSALLMFTLLCGQDDCFQQLWLSGYDVRRVSPELLFDAFLEGCANCDDVVKDAVFSSSTKKLRNVGVYGSPTIFVRCLKFMPCEDLAAVQCLYRTMWTPGKVTPPAWLDGTTMASLLSDPSNRSNVAVLQWCVDAGCSMGSSVDTCIEFEHEFQELEHNSYCDDLVKNDPAALVRWQALASHENGSALSNAAFAGAYHPRFASLRRWLMVRDCPCKGDLHLRRRLIDLEWEAAERVFATQSGPPALPST